MIRRFLLSSVLAASIVSMNAQVDVIQMMDTLNIAATSIPTSIATTGRNVTVISAKEIQQLPVASIDGVLRYIPGVEVQMRNGFGAQGDISMRGSTFTQVLILVDGMRLNDPLTGHFNSNIPIPLSEIDRIEVLRGPAASMYGPDAVGGVIHILTKTFATSRDNKNKTAANLDVDYGQNNLVAGNIGFHLQKDKLKIGMSGMMNRTDGQSIPAQSFINGTDTTQLESFNNYFDNRTATLSFSVPMGNQWQLSLRSAFDYRDFSARYFYTSSVFDKSTETTSNMWLQTQARRVDDNNSTDINFAYKFNTDEFIFSPDFSSTNNHITQFYNFQVNHLHQINEDLDIKIGIQTDYRTIESNDRGNHEDIHLGIYGIGVYRPKKGLQLVASLRGDYDQNYNFEIVPQVNMSYRANKKINLRAAIGRSIRAADYTERYVSNNLENLTPGRSLGNPNLNAESSWSEEIGVDFYPIPELRFTATGFFRQSSNLIDYVSTIEDDIENNSNLVDSASYFYATNIASVMTAGLETELWYTRNISTQSNVSLGVGYTFLNTTNENDVISVYLSNHARHLFTANLLYSYENISFAINGLYKARNGRQAPAINSELATNYTVWNLRFGYQIAEQIGVNLFVHNLLNEQYADILGAKMPNRWIMGGIRWQL